jgi:hypothetical protein
MKLTCKANLFDPIRDVWEKIQYKNINTFNELNQIIQENKIITQFNSNVNMGLFHALTQYENMNVCLCIGKTKQDSYDYYKQYLLNDYSLYGIKSFTFSYIMMIKIFYQILYFQKINQDKDHEKEDEHSKNTLHQLENESYIMSYLQENFRNISENSNTQLQVLILVSKKTKLVVHNKFGVSHHYEGIIMPHDVNEKYMLCGLFLCDQSLKFLEKQNLTSFFSFMKSRMMFETFECFIRKNIPIEYRHSFMVNSSSLLYLLGAREANDIDCYIHTIPEDLVSVVNCQHESGELDFLDYNIKNTEIWPCYWNKWLDIWASSCGARYFEEILACDHYHFYFLGIKLISLECDIQRRLKRLRPASFADLMMLKERFHVNITMPSIPEKENVYRKRDNLSIDKIVDYEKRGIPYDESTSEFILEKDIDLHKFKGTINHYLRERYNYEKKNEHNFSHKKVKIKINPLSKSKTK